MLNFSPQPEIPSYRSASLNRHVYRDFNIISNGESGVHEFFKHVQ